MEQIMLHFKNNLCKGTLFISRERLPHFYWCYFEDKEMIDAVGECIGFTEKEGEVVTTENISQVHKPVVEEIRQYILGHFYPTYTYQF